MLKGIPPVLSPELLKILAEMGHGDEIVVGDGNFPAATCAKRLIRADGHRVPELLDAILQLLPPDSYVDYPFALMAVGAGEEEPAIWRVYRDIIAKKAPGYEDKIEQIERFDFYERAKNAFAVIASGETAIYANLLIKKGVVKE